MLDMRNTVMSHAEGRRQSIQLHACKITTAASSRKEKLMVREMAWMRELDLLKETTPELRW